MYSGGSHPKESLYVLFPKRKRRNRVFEERKKVLKDLSSNGWYRLDRLSEPLNSQPHRPQSRRDSWKKNTT
ncbi:hypothetical protein TNCV_947661 [Trichonephila clavipes]|nr:hypothetical protein TNCV_947661 [Trichonephila clavipes]